MKIRLQSTVPPYTSTKTYLVPTETHFKNRVPYSKTKLQIK